MPLTTMNRRHAVLVQHLEVALGVGLDAGRGADHDDPEVGRANPGAHLADEVGVAGAVEEVDLPALVLELGQATG